MNTSHCRSVTVSNDQTVEHGVFRAVFWDAPKDLHNAVEDIVALLEFLTSIAVTSVREPQVNSQSCFFFRPTPYGSCQVVYQSGQPVAFCKFPELRQWQHHHDDNVHQKELGWIDT